jgi:Uncharacterised nucleotidyltransferase
MNGAGLRAVPTQRAPLWQAVDLLVDRAPRLSDLEYHGLHLLAASRRRSLGRAVPDPLREAERRAAVIQLAVPILLQQLRASCDGMLVLMKGPEAGALYPSPAARPFRDLDLLVADAPTVQRQLLSAGFELVGDPRLYVNIHHLRPLYWPGLPLIVEIHDRPKWIGQADPPPKTDLLAAAVPTSLGVEGIHALPPAQHALVLAAHAWAHVPLSKLMQVVDIAAVSEGADRDELEALARRWGLRRLWRSTTGVIDALLGDGGRPLVVRSWARNLPAVRERTVVESHLESWLCPWWVLPPRGALRQSSLAITAALRPEADETWGRKLRRTQHALRNAFVRRSEHDRMVEERDVQAPSMRGRS